MTDIITKTDIITTGYTHRTIKRFDLTVREGSLMVDIRYSPRSFCPQWRKAALSQRWGDQYLWIQAWGNPNYNSEREIEIADFDAGWTLLEPHLTRAAPIVLFCVCYAPEHCHRSVLAKMLLERKGISTREAAER